MKKQLLADLEILDRASATATGNRAEHARALAAVQRLRVHIDSLPDEPAPDENTLKLPL